MVYTSQLSQRDRDILELHRLGVHYGMIAKQYNLSEQHVRRLVKRAEFRARNRASGNFPKLEGGTAMENGHGEYFDLAELVRKRAKADGAIVIIIKGDDSRLAPDLPPTLLPYLPEILQSCAQQSAAFLRDLAEEVRPEVESLLKKRGQ